MVRDVFEPLRIGGVRLPNRIALAPVKTTFGPPDGRGTDRHVAYFRRRAAGGAGLIISEPLYVVPEGKEHPRQLGIDEDGKVAGLSRIVSAVHAEGALAFAHLNHAGRAANPKASGTTPEAPSAVPCPATGATPREMSASRIRDVVEAFSAAARRAREAGFDGIELQYGLGYLVAQFLSPRTNRREDEYGGDLDRRLAFPRAVLAAVRAVTGPEMAVSARFSATEQVPGGLVIEDALGILPRLEEEGLQAVHVVSGSACDSPPWYYQHMSLPEATNRELAARIREGVGIPVIAAGRLGDPETIRSVIRQGGADAVALGRPLVADPDLPLKMKEGREEEIVACGSCLQGCLAKVKAGEGLMCIVNPEVGREGERVSPPGDPRRIVVIGGGPAGMTAAVTARQRGHDVTLVERSSTLGGQFALAFLSPGKESMERPFRSLVRSAEHAGIEILLDTDATPEVVLSLRPDLVILATGASPIVPAVSGLDAPLTGEEVLTESRTPGHRVLVLGGGLVGMEVAEWLAIRDREVVVVEMLDDVARDMETVARKLTLKRLAGMNVEIVTSAALVRVEEGEAFVRREEKETSLGSFDSFVVSVGVRPRRKLEEELVDLLVPIHVIGDADHPGQVLDAVHAAHDLAANL